MMVVLGLVLSRAVPVRAPRPHEAYGALIVRWRRLRSDDRSSGCAPSSSGHCSAHRALFWTTTPLLLAGPGTGAWFRSAALALFACERSTRPSGADGRPARRERLWPRPSTRAAIGVVATAFLRPCSVGGGLDARARRSRRRRRLAWASASSGVVARLRAVFSLGADARTTVNGVFCSNFFAAGASGSARGASTYTWPPLAELADRIGLALPLITLSRFVYRVMFRRV